MHAQQADGVPGTRAPRAVARAAIGLTLLLAALAVATAVPGPAAYADTTSVPGTLTTRDEQTGPLSVTVPPGVVPTALTAVLAMPVVVDGGSVTVLVNGREALTVPSRLYQQLAVPVGAGDVVADGTLAVSVRWNPPAGATGCEPTPELVLRKLALAYDGLETPPTTPSAFWPARASRVDVVVARDAADDVLGAALAAVAALSRRYPAGTPVELVADDQPLPIGAGGRVVRIVAADAPASATVDPTVDPTASPPTLVLAGSGTSLLDAARDIAGETASTTPVEAGSQPVTRPVTRTLDELRADAPGPSTSAVGTQVVTLRQDAFGGPVSTYAVHLSGTHSAVPAGAQARLDVTLGDQLVRSLAVDGDGPLDLDVTVPASALTRSSDVLRVTLRSAADAASACSPGLPLELSLDGAGSRVTATPASGDDPPGAGPSGLQLFPPSLDGRLPVALRDDGTDRLDLATRAAVLISALQREAATTLDVELVDADALVTGVGSGLLVGADASDAALLGAPVPLSGMDLPAYATAAGASTTAPYGVLQAVGQLVEEGSAVRRVLLLGSWAPGGGPASAGWTRRITASVADDGWRSLVGDAVVLGRGGRPTVVDSGTETVWPLPPTSRVDTTAGLRRDEPRSSYAGWLALAVGGLLVLGAVRTAVGARRSRRHAFAVERVEPVVAPVVDPAADVGDSLSRGRQPQIDLRRWSGRPASRRPRR